MNFFRPFITLFGILFIWEAITKLSGIQAFLLPSPLSVIDEIFLHRMFLFRNLLITLTEIFLGLLLGTLFGASMALVMDFSKNLQRWLLPLLILSQAIPVFALAPLLVLWLGFGLASKILLALLVIFFPVTITLYDGLRHTDPGFLDLAKTMNASRFSTLLHVRLMAALPSFGAGLRIAAVIAPIGAILGEWAGASAGLGYVMINANAQMQTSLMFAALALLFVVTVLLWASVNFLLKKLLYWTPNNE